MAFVPLSNGGHIHLLPPLFSAKRIYFHVILLLFIVLLLCVIRFMTEIRGTFLYYHAESDTDLELVTVPKSFAKDRGAFCIDGSPPAYYFRPSPGMASSSWLIYLPGGAWCTSEEDCFKRSLTALGSSHVAPTKMLAEGLLSPKCSINPDFCLWNVAVFHYCDGGSFLGNQSRRVEYQGRQLYLRGARVFDALLDYLLAAGGLTGARQAVLAGSSSGGLGALIHADRLRSRLPAGVRTLHALVDAGVFPDVPDIHGQRTMAGLMQAAFLMHRMKDTEAVQECTAAMTARERVTQGWHCLTAAGYTPHVYTPTFFAQSVYDTWTRTNSLKVPCFAVTCPEANLDVVYANRDAVKEFGRTVGAGPRHHAVFLTACPMHVLMIHNERFEAGTPGSPSLKVSLSAWLQHEDKQPGTADLDLSLEAAIEGCQAGL